MNFVATILIQQDKLTRFHSEDDDKKLNLIQRDPRNQFSGGSRSLIHACTCLPRNASEYRQKMIIIHYIRK